MSDTPPQTIAAVDLGSNSFHLIVARPLPGGEFQVLDRIKDRVKLAAGLDAAGLLSRGTIGRALDTLERFGQRVAELPPGSVRAVGTNTLRKARNGADLLAQGSAMLGHPIEVISGAEEARLIWRGVASEFRDDQSRFVVDIGGGSTEIIVGREAPEILDSLHMGCVSWSERFFGSGMLTEEAWEAAVTAAQLQLRPVKRQYREANWDLALGSSGTVLAIERILRATEWSEHGITLDGLRSIRSALVRAGRIGKLDLPGLGDDRRDVIAGGAAILYAVLRTLRIKTLHTSRNALREGLLRDLIGRLGDHDARDDSVRQLVERFDIDLVQAERVKGTALALFEQAAAGWGLVEEDQRLLAWAAQLHEIGMMLSYSGYHKHGAYLLSHTDMAGFSHQEKRRLSALVLAHRGRFSKDRIRAVYAGKTERTLRLALLLRLAVRLQRSRKDTRGTVPTLVVDGQGITLSFPEGWLAQHALTRADLTEERRLLSAEGLSLEIGP